jgi:TRAP-type C4-dicarboxylate transport system permease small subunit
VATAKAPAKFDDDGVVRERAKVPPTRQHEVPAERPSGLSLTPPVTYPNDGPISARMRSADGYLGIVEQVILVAILASVVCTAAAAAISDKVFGHQLGRWWFDIVRGGTFSVAMMGAVFATHQQRHLAMDLISKRLPPRGRLVLRVILGAFTIGVALLLLRSGLHQLDTVGEEGGEHFVSTRHIVMFMPAGAALIILHTLLHMVIDVDYLARGVLPPERARSGH